tara:strand:+ start:1147 stop:1461 length:315 start_codon:yes stop_codon:yes gene_type:complete
MTHNTKTPPAKTTSTVFIATSIDIIDIKDMPVAVLKASLRFICLERIIVSSIIEVINPLMTAKVMIPNMGNAISLSWKNRIVPKSPIEHPNKHHKVLIDERFHV